VVLLGTLLASRGRSLILRALYTWYVVFALRPKPLSFSRAPAHSGTFLNIPGGPFLTRLMHLPQPCNNINTSSEQGLGC
jgi:hypothetical protein